jgi:hypothetical protein
MAVSFYRGQQLGRGDLAIYLANANGTPSDAAEITYALYDFTTGQEVMVGSPRRVPMNPAVGEYYASIIVPLDANLGSYRIRWSFRELVNGPIQQALQEFEVADKQMAATIQTYTSCEADLIRRFRILLRDNNPDRNYHFRPPTHEETIRQFSRVFGYIWENEELIEYLERSKDMISLSPPLTPFGSLDSMCGQYPAWKTLLLTGAMYWALQALRINWIADEFDYSIGGVSLSLDRASKYEGAASSASEQFDKMLEKAKATVNIIKGLQQPRYGAGVRSAFGPYVGRGVLSPRKFVGL